MSKRVQSASEASELEILLWVLEKIIIKNFSFNFKAASLFPGAKYYF